MPGGVGVIGGSNMNTARKEMALADKSKTHTANAQFMKLQRAEDGKKAMSEYETAAAALRAKTVRLRALRLAKEAEEGSAPAKAPAAGKVKKAKASTKKSSSTLSTWLSEQQKDGHKS
jgi:hypothetical protein